MATGDLVDRLVELGDRSPDRLLYVELLDGVNESKRFTAADLIERASAIAAGLRAQGVKQGDAALHIASSPLDFLAGLFGCLWAGVIAAPVSFPRRPDHLTSRLEPVKESAGAVALVAAAPQNDEQREILGLLTAGDLPVISMDVEAPPTPVAPVPNRDIAYLQYTSGSTSLPKGVIVTHANLMANLGEITWLLDMSEDMTTVSWTPLTHDMGLVIGALPGVYHGTQTVLLTPSAFIRRPLVWLKAIDKDRGTHTNSPNFGYDLCVERTTPNDRESLDLSSMRGWFNGAEPVRAITKERFLNAFAVSGNPPESWAPGWGLAEATVLVTTVRPDDTGKVVWVDGDAIEHDRVVVVAEGAEGARPLCSDGPMGPGYDLRIVDPNTLEALPADQVGEVWVRGDSVSPGYWRNADATAGTFGFSVVGETEGAGEWMRTGDLGFLWEDELVICGRAKDLIIINGRNIHPQDVELTVEESHPEVRLGGSAAFAIQDDDGVEALVVLAEVDGEPNAEEIKRAIVAAVLMDFEVRVADVLLVGPREVPKTSSGKKQRSAAREQWRRAQQQTADV